MKIKCFALWQPWASLVIHGFKKIETRPMYSAHRGITGIHVTKTQPLFCEQLFYTEPFFSRLKSVGYERFAQLPQGGVLGLVEVVSWLKVVVRDPVHKQVEMNKPADSIEATFGNYEAGRYGIHLKNPVKFEKLFPAKGTQSMLFDIDFPDELLASHNISTMINN